jgi:DNA-binding transcriptional ArsR family regulator
VVTYESVFSALADPTRRSIFERLRHGPSSVAELAGELPVTRPAVSQHLKVLSDAGLVCHEVRGTRHYYSIDPSGLQALRNYLDEFWGELLSAFKVAAEQATGGRDESHDN